MKKSELVSLIAVLIATALLVRSVGGARDLTAQEKAAPANRSGAGASGGRGAMSVGRTIRCRLERQRTPMETTNEQRRRLAANALAMAEDLPDSAERNTLLQIARHHLLAIVRQESQQEAD